MNIKITHLYNYSFQSTY